MKLKRNHGLFKRGRDFFGYVARETNITSLKTEGETLFLKTILPRVALLIVLPITLLFVAPVIADDWPQWRGLGGNNHAAEGTDVPTRWNLSNGENIQWKVKLPGRGHSSPAIIDDGIFMTAADAATQTQSVLKVQRDTGLIVDQWVIHRGTLPARIHPKNSHASPSPAFDGERIYVSFHTDDAIWLTAITTNGRIVWKKKVCNFKPSAFQFGYGASPIVEDSLVIVAAEYDGPDSGLYALDTRTGKRVWKVKRPVNLNFASPIVASIAGQRQVLLSGGDLMSAYDPQTGRVLWETQASTEAICGTTVWDRRLVMVSGGNPVSGTWCVAGDGSEKVLWQKRVKCYEQSLLSIANYVFAIADSGVVYCWRTQDGKEMWQKRLFAGNISASPLLVDDRIYIADERGTVYVIAASPDRFDLLSKNSTGDSIFASPVAVDDRIYIRTALGVGDARQEYLVAIGAQ